MRCRVAFECMKRLWDNNMVREAGRLRWDYESWKNGVGSMEIINSRRRKKRIEGEKKIKCM